MYNHKIRIGIVGAGNIAYMHEAGYTEIADLCELVAFCDIDEELATGRAEPHHARIYSNYQQLLAAPDIDMLDITVPHHLHYPIARAALEAGKHVLVEKPMAMTSAQALELIETAKRAHVCFTVAENTHFVLAYQEARRLLQAGTLGKIRFVRTAIMGSEAERTKDPASWVGKSTNQGVLLDSGVHTFYLLKWLLGDVVDIQASSYKLLSDGQEEDHVLASGHLANGTLFTTIQSCALEVPWTERLEIYGSLGSLIIDQLANPPAIHFRGSDDLDGLPCASIPYEPLAWKYFSIVAEVQDFVHAILEERPPLIDPLYGYHAIQALEAAYQSIKEGGKSITLQRLCASFSE